MGKDTLRQEMKKRLKGMSDEQRIAKSKKACRYLTSTRQFQNAAVVMVYLSVPEEIDTTEIVLKAWEMKKTVAAPKIMWEHEHLIPVQINSLEAGFQKSPSGLRNPLKGDPVPYETIDLVVTPGLGFDEKGNRLGRGGAYYDKFFTHEQLTACKCGFAFSEQILDSLPITNNDVPMDLVVTDTGVSYFNQFKMTEQGG